MTAQMTNGALWAQRWQKLLQDQGIDSNGDIVGHGNDIVPALRVGDTWISNVTLLGDYAGDSETFTWQYTLR